MNKILIPLIEKGYKVECEELTKLVKKRLNTDGDLIFDYYAETNRQYLDKHCNDFNIDQLTLGADKASKVKIGTQLITEDIKDRQHIKGEWDKELKKLDIPTISITNGIESECKWYIMLGNPGDKQWVTKRTKRLIDSGKLSNVVIKELKEASEFISENYIPDNILRPDIDAYWNLGEYPISEKALKELAKLSGN